MIAQSLGMSGPGGPLLPVLRAISYAIAHHHTTSAHEYGATSISRAVVPAIKKAMEYVRREGVWTYDLQRLELNFAKGDLFPVSLSRGKFTQPDVTSGAEDLLETWLAFLIVRALRLADQRADLYASLKV
jgi:CRISPR-associated endonuclease/helicase Cas3